MIYLGLLTETTKLKHKMGQFGADYIANESSVDQSASLTTEGTFFLQSAPFSPSSEAVCCW